MDGIRRRGRKRLKVIDNVKSGGYKKEKQRGRLRQKVLDMAVVSLVARIPYADDDDDIFYLIVRVAGGFPRPRSLPSSVHRSKFILLVLRADANPYVLQYPSSLYAFLFLLHSHSFLLTILCFSFK